jgi:Uncharacterized protein conserved in bacteria (DUF2188)
MTMPQGDTETYYGDGKWKNKVQGSSRAANSGERKAEVQAKSREMAEKRGVEHIGERNTYPRTRDPRSRDPRSSKG